jgi:hypothetical protein
VAHVQSLAAQRPLQSSKRDLLTPSSPEGFLREHFLFWKRGF